MLLHPHSFLEGYGLDDSVLSWDNCSDIRTVMYSLEPVPGCRTFNLDLL